jgi:hypothetical protein
MNTRRSGVIGLLVMVCSAGISLGEVITFDGDTDDTWGTPANWSTNSVPGADDRAVIPNGSEFAVVIGGSDDFTVDSLEIGGDATLTIEEGGRLVLESDDAHSCALCGGDAGDDHHINGDIVLEGTQGTGGSTLRFESGEGHIVRGSGSILGGAPECKLAIDTDVEVTNQLATTGNGIVGSLTISGVPFSTSPHARDGAFVNDGIVRSSTGKIVLSWSTGLDDTSDGEWLVEGNCGAGFVGTMEFRRAALLDGDFIPGPDGCFHFFEDVSTCGALVDEFCIGLEVESGVVFSYADYLGGMLCFNPGTDPGGDIDCNNPYTYDENDPPYCASCP